MKPIPAAAWLRHRTGRAWLADAALAGMVALLYLASVNVIGGVALTAGWLLLALVVLLAARVIVWQRAKRTTDSSPLSEAPSPPGEDTLPPPRIGGYRAVPDDGQTDAWARGHGRQP